MLVEIKVVRARPGADIHDHRVKDGLHRLGDSRFMGFRLHRQGHAKQGGDLASPRAGGIDKVLASVAALICDYTIDAPIIYVDLGYFFVKVELSASSLSMSIEGGYCFER